MNTRKYHRVISLFISIPLLIIICTGILLIARGKLEFIQPKTRETQSQNILSALSYQDIKTIVEKNDNVKSFDKVSDIIYKPSKGIILVRTKNNYELQIDPANGQIIHEAPRYTSLLTSIHEGAWFHPLIKDWIFLPSAILFLTILISGIQIYFLPILRRANYKKKKEKELAKQI